MRAQEISRLAEEARQAQCTSARDRFFETLLSSAQEFLQVPFVGLWVSDPLKGNFHRVSPNPAPSGEDVDVPILDDLSVVGEIVRSKKPFVSSEIRSVPNWRRREWSEEVGFVSYAGLPITVHRQGVGVLSALDEKPRVFSPREMELLREFSDVASIMVSRCCPDLSLEPSCCSCRLCFVREGSVLSCLDEEQIEEYQKLRKASIYPKNSVIFHEGDVATGLHFICVNRVKLVKTDEEGRSIIIRIANPGELLGKTSFFTGRPYFTTAVTLGRAQIAYLPREKFLRFLSNNSELLGALTRELSTELEILYQRLFKSAFNDNKRRLASHILSLRETYGQEVPEGMLVNIELRHADLAEMIGTSTRTIIRVMNLFRDQEIIRTARHKVIILDEPRLLTYAGEIF